MYFRITALACSAILFGAASQRAEAGHATRSPSIEMCYANVPDNTIIYETCPDKRMRLCPNHLALGVPACVVRTPEELAAENREAVLAAARADAKRIIEQDRKRQIDEETARLGASRRAEAERLVDMRRKSEEARGLAERAEELAERLDKMTPKQRAAYERCRQIARAGHATCQ